MATSNHVWSDLSCINNALLDVNIIERIVTEIFEAFLDIETLDISKSFFDLGGDSLKALILTAELAKAFDTQLPPTMLYDFPSIRDVVSEVARLGNESRTIKDGQLK